TSAKLFDLRSVRIVQIRKRIGSEAWDLFISDFGVGCERVADAESVMPNETDDIAGIGLVQCFAFVAEKFMRTGKTHLLRGARVVHRHVALEFAGANADEGDAVAMFRVHVRLNFENETGKCGMLRRNLKASHDARL